MTGSGFVPARSLVHPVQCGTGLSSGAEWVVIRSHVFLSQQATTVPL